MGSIDNPPRFYVEPADVPEVDYAALRGSGQARKIALVQLDQALKTYGFAYIANHSIPPTTVDSAFDWSRRVFQLPVEVKAQIAHPNGHNPHRGWVYDGLSYISQMVFDHGQVRTLRETQPERKETLETGNPYNPDKTLDNKWLSEEVFPGHKAFFESWWDECVTLNHNLLQSLCEILGLEPDYLSRFQTKNECHMSWQYYPSMPLKPLRDSRYRRMNPHTDFGQLTLLFQDMIGGLEIHDGVQYRPVMPKPNTVVINVGDLLERQSNGRWKSALHRVVAPSQLMVPSDDVEVDAVVKRYSIAYFGTPDPGSIISTLPGCEKQGAWQPNMMGDWHDDMTVAEWIEKRLAMEYEQSS